MHKIKHKTFKEALNRVAASDDGKIVLAMIKDDCQWDMTVLDTTDPVRSMCYAVKRGLYGGLRKHINREHLKSIEYDYEIEKEEVINAAQKGKK